MNKGVESAVEPIVNTKICNPIPKLLAVYDNLTVYFSKAGFLERDYHYSPKDVVLVLASSSIIPPALPPLRWSRRPLSSST
jgi:hypothetical protein